MEKDFFTQKALAERLQLELGKVQKQFGLSMTEIEEWAATVSPDTFIDAAAKRGPGEQPQLQVWHFVALGQAGNVEQLRIYKDRFERGERAEFPSFITADTVQRAIYLAQT